MKRENPFQPIYTRCNSGDPYDKLANLPSFPRYLDIELTNLCNFQCLMCPVGTGTMKRQRGLMDKTIFSAIIEEVKQYRAPIRFIRWGEPTLHPQLLDFIVLAKRNGLLCHLNTNGSRMTPELIRGFIDIPLDSIKFSFQGVTRQSFLEMRNIDFFDRLIETIRQLYRERGDRYSPFIHAATTTTYETQEQIDSFLRMMKNHADLVTVGKTKMDIIDLEKVRLSREKTEQLKHLKTKESLIKTHFAVCPEVFDKLSVNWDGTVSACCADFDNKMLVGDIRENSLAEIWQSEKMNTYRKIIAARRYDAIELCSICYDTMGLQRETDSPEGNE